MKNTNTDSALIAAFLAKGGKVTKCAPAPRPENKRQKKRRAYEPDCSNEVMFDARDAGMKIVRVNGQDVLVSDMG